MSLSSHSVWLNVGTALIYGCTCWSLNLGYILGGFIGGKPCLQACPVILSSLLQESSFWPLPGCVQPTNDSDCMSVCLSVCVQEFVCVPAWGAGSILWTIFTLKCMYDTAQYLYSLIYLCGIYCFIFININCSITASDCSCLDEIQSAMMISYHN